MFILFRSCCRFITLFLFMMCIDSHCMDSNEQATLRQFGGLWMAELKKKSTNSPQKQSRKSSSCSEKATEQQFYWSQELSHQGCRQSREKGETGYKWTSWYLKLWIITSTCLTKGKHDCGWLWKVPVCRPTYSNVVLRRTLFTCWYASIVSDAVLVGLCFRNVGA